MMYPISALLRSVAAAAMFLAGGAALPPCARAAPATPSPKVVVISLDAFGAASLREPQLPAPTLHGLMQRGAYAVSMQPINPTVTWPNHTTMVTGVDASRHHVLVNGLIVDQRTATSPRIDMGAPKSRLVAVPTVYDAAHQAGLTTAQVDWVAIDGARSIDWQFAEHPDPDGAIEQSLVRQGVVTRDQLVHFGEPSQAWRDRIYTRAAVDIIRQHHPDLLLLHLLALDSIEHETGFGNDAGRNTIAFLDDRVQEVIDAVRAAGDLDRTTFIIVSDHGQQSVRQLLRPNVLLRQAGLQGGSTGRPAFCLTDDGFALVFQQHATEASTRKMKSLFAGKPGIRAVLTPAEAAKQGWPVPAQSDQAPDLLLYAADGYAFKEGDTGDYVTPTREIGAHGYPNSNPLMQGIFIAAGAGIRARGEIPAFPNLDIAPTIAQLLHVSLGTVQGKPLMEILGSPGHAAPTPARAASAAGR
ncbi:alkaline phosphatase family protein [Rhodanobacter denitrificans]|uniref:Alkaline phosphatase family protein n=1 Tax=Rhodanobacter denitrificans TaxID=666685 RepID=A0A368KAJ2_9GAMM|nr:ectonucleotide pyrophosphatase/phosphodiesterase [Rhodanobacter denitrificans]RCS28864.1 alkaline phosphatase family protein [Rhodanobacter denitrificans]